MKLLELIKQYRQASTLKDERRCGVSDRSLVSQLGMGMMELILVIIVSAIIIIGALMYYAHWKSDHRINQAMTGVSQMAANIKKLYAANPNYTGITNTVAINANAVPNALLWNGAGGKEIITPWYTGGTSQSVIALAPYSGGRQFSIELQNIPVKACIQIGSDMLDQGEGLSAVLPGTATAGVTTVTQVSTDCGATDPTNLTLVFQ
jgi:hypothetical protein